MMSEGDATDGGCGGVEKGKKKLEKEKKSTPDRQGNQRNDFSKL